jgi:hypothetical protein
MQKSAIEQIKELKAQLESKTEQAKAEAPIRPARRLAFCESLDWATTRYSRTWFQRPSHSQGKQRRKITEG